ncbi:maltose alpha-D-glucosyltransferase [Granulicella arctica]|uniref:Maltokinase n=1 Tax=Granulicella arctica TaxID=940613 RepID=A0A7Y9PHS1_9BACT|nr:maltose alpha-D-glucosyltransferase [Granulicella arctica]NYF79401.1 maltose alpha-D-glucosyltransferase/alpha-amylase [Granulicella arctica]
MKKAGSATDPLWYKDAIIYEIHVRAFMDSNGDGIGDFQGLISKLDYLQDLGVTCLWLLPFFPSPLRDDGYDIANYNDVNPSYGTIADFQQFLNEAHLRNMQVMIELVINHTSDQHPWFQAARLAPPGSPERNMYVWSDTIDLYKEARIIFTDTEKSNWTWDDTAKQFYWHRFFSHQPDLNFDNPRVMEEVLNAMRFWMDMGIDGLRLDAIPYLLERDGTSCENVPETHAKIKEIRAVIDAEYENRLVLAEANMWPADVRPYFGDGDECHMAFHFPLMPRIYMALRQEDRLPITDIMAQTPEIPDNCQWGLFLRNHDELTLEMVTDDERDYMYLAYSADPRMRINVGIRRRLAPLVDNNRRRIELLNSLLLSFPGTPIMYYGDEIGMGDNIYLGDRNGVRTPMQWNSDRNAGFSRAVPAKLYFPVIMDPIWGYQAINVEAQQSDQSSLLHWTRNMIALRKLFQVFGRGTLEFLHPDNRKILAYIRRYDPYAASAAETAAMPASSSSETILCVANLSRFAQPVSLDLSQFAGMLPVEMLGYVSFPPITAQPYPLTIAPYSFLWLELQSAPQTVETPTAAAEAEDDAVALDLLASGWASLLTGPGLKLLQKTLPTYLPNQRWFGAKSRTIETINVRDWAEIPGTGAALFFLDLVYTDGQRDTYQLPLAHTTGHEAEELLASAPASVLATLKTPTGPMLLHDAVLREELRQSLLTLIADDAAFPLGNTVGDIHGHKSTAFDELRGHDPLPARTGSAEQSNTSILYNGKLIMKLFRRLQTGENPDTEIGRFLTETAHFPRIAPFLGDITLTSATGEPTTLAMLQGLVPNEGDGWQWTLDELSRYYDSCANLPIPDDLGTVPSFLSDAHPPAAADEHAGFYLDAAALLGRRTAEMHLALATPTDNPAFVAEPFSIDDLNADAQRIQTQISQSLDALKRGMSQLSDLTTDSAALLLSRRIELFSRTHAITAISPQQAGQRIRIHGDYHLGQVLRSKVDYVILDFEGEPARTLAERRAKQSPLKDVAGMLRSFSYAAFAGLEQFSQRRPEAAKNSEPWARLWQNAVATAFLRAYRQAIAANPHLIPQPPQAQVLLNAYLLEKSLYELLYELNNRPAWVRIPLAGILALPTESSR